MNAEVQDATNLVDAAAAQQAATSAEAQSAAAQAGGKVAEADANRLAFSYDEKAAETVFGKRGEDGRPANLEPKYWDADTKQIKGDLLVSQNRWYASKLGKKLEVIGGPADGTEYAINVPKEIKVGDEVRPVDFDIDPEDSAVRGFLTVARKHDVSQAFVDEVMGEVSKEILNSRGTNWTEEMKKLGKDAPARLNDFRSFLSAQLDPKQVTAITDLITSADAFNAVEALVRATSGGRFVASETELVSGVGKMTIEQWNEMNFETIDVGGGRMERRRSVDPAFNAKVEALRDEVFGTTRRDASGQPVTEHGQRTG